METFDDKLQVQKITYLGQESGIDLGYLFEWYRRGPYCKLVSEDAHEAIKNNLTQDQGLDGKTLERFAETIKPHNNDTEWLEIAASLQYLRKYSYEGKPLDQIIGYLIEDLTYGYKNFNEITVRKVIDQMLQYGILRD